MSDNEKRHTIDPTKEGHSYRRPQTLTDSEYLEWVLTMPKDLFKEKLFGPKGKEFSDSIEQASRRILEESEQ